MIQSRASFIAAALIAVAVIFWTLLQFKKERNIRTILCFVIQREDVTSFQPSNIDPIYKTAVTEAYHDGVEIKAIQVNWKIDGSVTIINDNLQINI